LWGSVTDLLLNINITEGLWHELHHFLSSEHGNVTDVSKSLNLVKVHQVVGHPEVVVIVHGDVEGLHGFGSNSALGDSTVHLVFRLHEEVVLLSDVVDYVWSVDLRLVSVPGDWGKVRGTSGGSVEIIKDALELGLLFSRFVVYSSSSQSVQPLAG
jgi:hypothetical protein